MNSRFRNASPWARIFIAVAAILPPIQTVWTFWYVTTESVKHWKEASSQPLTRYLLTWAATIFIFFSISSAKLPHYILPVIAPLALLTANSLATREKTHARNMQVVMGMGILFTFLLGGLQTSWYVQSGQAEAHTMALRHPEIDTVFRLSRQQQDMGTGTTSLQQTSLPSLIMVLNKPVKEFDDPELVEPGSVIFTRVGRVQPEWGWNMQEKGQRYEIWTKSRKPLSQ